MKSELSQKLIRCHSAANVIECSSGSGTQVVAASGGGVARGADNLFRDLFDYNRVFNENQKSIFLECRTNEK